MSQDAVRDALRKIPDMVVFKPADDARNWKPCDFMVWWALNPLDVDGTPLRSAWIEVKQNDNVNSYVPELRPAQNAAMLNAAEIGLPYLLVVYWKRRRAYSVHVLRGRLPPPMTWDLATSRHGINSTPDNLANTLHGVLNGDAGL